MVIGGGRFRVLDKVSEFSRRILQVVYSLIYEDSYRSSRKGE